MADMARSVEDVIAWLRADGRILANTMNVEILSRVPDEAVEEMRAYVLRKVDEFVVGKVAESLSHLRSHEQVVKALETHITTRRSILRADEARDGSVVAQTSRAARRNELDILESTLRAALAPGDPATDQSDEGK